MLKGVRRAMEHFEFAGHALAGRTLSREASTATAVKTSSGPEPRGRAGIAESIGHLQPCALKAPCKARLQAIASNEVARVFI